ncbi:MAG TPA: LPS export ABC transporter periplasmic protein LptC, partial [Vicinamibacteria bacterium]
MADTPRVLRRALLGLVAAVIGALSWTLRRPEAPKAAPTEASGPSVSKGETLTRGLVFRSFKEGKAVFVLEADTSIGKEETGFQLGGVKLTFRYTAQGKEGSADIVADECTYEPRLPRAVFRGGVVLRSEDGFELRTESLTYRGDKSVAKTEDHAEFARKAFSGSSTGFVYDGERDELELPADARVRIADEGQVPTEIRSGKAFFARTDGTLRFEGGVHVAQGEDTLRSERLLLSFDLETQALARAIAVDDVVLDTTGRQAMPGLAPAAGGGPRHLEARKVTLGFRSDRSIEEVIAQTDVDLVLLPGPGEPNERRRIRAGDHLILDSDEQGRITAVRGKANRGEEGISLEVQPLARGGAVQTVSCFRFEARLDPESGEVRGAQFFENVVFTRGKQRATGRRARYTGGDDPALVLQGGPQVEDEHGRLTAQAIRLETSSGNVRAAGEVRHILQTKGETLFSAKDAPTLLTSGKFSSSSRSRTATYSEGALLRSGKDEVRASTIVVTEDASGRREL